MKINRIVATAMVALALVAHTAALAPAGTPREVIARLNAEITAAVGTPELSGRLRSMYFDLITATPEAFADILRGDLARWGRVVREAKVKAD